VDELGGGGVETENQPPRRMPAKLDKVEGRERQHRLAKEKAG